MGVTFAFGLLFCISIHRGFSQCTGLDFNSPATACLSQNINFSTIGPYSNYEWDFCAGDLSLTPTSSVLNNAFGGQSFKVELAEQNGVYYGFLLAKARSVLYRLDFGTDINSQPTLVDLGGLGISSSTGRVIEIVKEGNLYYGFIMDGNGIYRVDFGTSLSNMPSAALLIYSGPEIANPIDMVVVEDGTSKFLFLANLNATHPLVRMTFDQSFTGALSYTNDINVGSVFYISGISFIKECETWYCVATAGGNSKVFKISFNGGLADTNPTITDFALSGVTGVALVNDDDQYYAFIQHTSINKLYRLNFGNSLSNPSPTTDELLNIGIGSDFWALAMYKVKSDWLAMSTDGSGPNIYRITFPNNCFSPDQYSTAQSPTILSSTPGTYHIALRAEDSQGDWLSKSHVIQVDALPAPDIDFSSQNVCANNNVDFTEINSSGDLVSRTWSFGDTGTSTIANPSHAYATAGSFTVHLSVDALNGCSNDIQKALQIYNMPIADFNLPSVNPICTNQNYLLSNTSFFDAGSNPTWEWRLNGSLASSQQDFIAFFNATTAQEIRLKALIPGCQNEVIKTISTVLIGPLVNFSASDNCLGASVTFTNSTTGADAGFVWAFGDASTSTATNPSHIYTSATTFQTTLTASNSLGCQNFLTKPIKIYSLPAPDFSVGLPPFSCSNSPTPFQNNTPSLTDSNIVGWSWQFNDVAGGTSSQQSPSYTFTTFGTFAISLTATSDAACSAVLTQNIAIAPSPVADFSQGPACVSQSTKFTDLSSGGVQSRLWQIASASFTIPNPSFTFMAPGNFPATLTVTGANGCSNVKLITVNVPVPPSLVFSMVNPCAGKNALFTDGTSSPQDAIVGWNWNFDENSLAGNPAEYNFPDQDTYNVKMTTTHASGCKYTLSNNIVINPSPAALFTASPDRGAAPLTVQFENFSQQATGYLWKFYDKVTATSTRISPVYTFTSLGDYTAELTAVNSQGCSDVLSVPIKVLIPSVDLVMQDFSLTNDPVTGKIKSVVTILNNSNIPVGSAEVALFLADKAVVNETVDLNLNPGQSATKTLSFTLSSNQFDFSFLCAEVLSDKDIQSDNNKRCINFEKNDYFFGPYPNPTAGTLQVDWISEKSGTVLIVIYDNMGKKSYEWEAQAQTGLNQSVHDLTFLSTGLYYLTIETSGAKKTIRFLYE